MTGYVIQRTSDGQFVRRTISLTATSSYTKLLQEAMVYKTAKIAQGDLCPENERIVSIDDVFLNPHAR